MNQRSSAVGVRKTRGLSSLTAILVVLSVAGLAIGWSLFEGVRGISKDDESTNSTSENSTQSGTMIVSTGTRAAISLEDLVAQSDAVVLGHVERTLPSTEFRDPVTGRDLIFTDSVFLVENQLRGKTPNKLIVRTLGGQVGRTAMNSPDEARLSEGQRVILFLTNRGGDRFSLNPNEYLVLGGSTGVVRVIAADDQETVEGAFIVRGSKESLRDFLNQLR